MPPPTHLGPSTPCHSSRYAVRLAPVFGYRCYGRLPDKEIRRRPCCWHHRQVCNGQHPDAVVCGVPLAAPPSPVRPTSSSCRPTRWRGVNTPVGSLAGSAIRSSVVCHSAFLRSDSCQTASGDARRGLLLLLLDSGSRRRGEEKGGKKLDFAIFGSFPLPRSCHLFVSGISGKDTSPSSGIGGEGLRGKRRFFVVLDV